MRISDWSSDVCSSDLDLVRYYRSAIKRRRRGRVIRMEIEAGLPPAVVEMLQDMLQGHESIISDVDGFVGIGELSGIVDEDRTDLTFAPYAPRLPERIREHGGDCFKSAKQHSEFHSLNPTSYSHFLFQKTK